MRVRAGAPLRAQSSVGDEPVNTFQPVHIFLEDGP